MASDGSSAVGGGAGAAPVDRDLAAQFRKRNNEQAKKIKDMINGNLELQSMVLATIERYRTGQSSDGDVLNLAGKVATGPKRKADETSMELVIEALDKAIGRSGALYSSWGKKRMVEALFFFDRWRLLRQDAELAAQGPPQRVVRARHGHRMHRQVLGPRRRHEPD